MERRAMNNKLSDLNNFLFAQLERLDNPEMTDEEFEREIKRSKAITETGKMISDLFLTQKKAAW